jgi:hypothetical protein
MTPGATGARRLGWESVIPQSGRTPPGRGPVGSTRRGFRGRVLAAEPGAEGEEQEP